MNTGNSSTFHVQCPSCHKRLAVPVQPAGKKGKCPGCGDTFLVNAAPPAPPLGQPSASVQPAAQQPIPQQLIPLKRVSQPPVEQQLTPLRPMELDPTALPHAPASGNDLFQDLPETGSTLYDSPLLHSPALQNFTPLASQAPHQSASTANPEFNMTQHYMGRAIAEQNERRAQDVHDAVQGWGDGSAAGILAGCGGMAIAIVWLFVGLISGILYFYPIFIFIAGLLAMLRGLSVLRANR